MSDSHGGVGVCCKDLSTGVITYYDSKLAASKALGCSVRTITRRIDSGKPLVLSNSISVIISLA